MSSNWITNVVQAPDADAVFKAKDDIVRIASNEGFRVLNVYRYPVDSDDDDALFSRIDGIIGAVRAGDLVVFQYPTYNGLRYEKTFCDRVQARGAKFAMFVHDAEAIRAIYTDEELGVFNECDALITHNPAMTTKLAEMGVKVPMFANYAFDFLSDASRDFYVQARGSFEKRLVFAGNLDKSRFLANWSYDTPITAFGSTPQHFVMDDRVDYRGSFAQEQLPFELPYGFGMAWDSDTNNENGGADTYRDYTRYNNPHKVSMYLASGLPVVLWSQAGMARFVTANHVGLVIDSLDDVDRVMAALEPEELQDMLQHAQAMRDALRSGFFTRRVLAELERQIAHKDISLV